MRSLAILGMMLLSSGIGFLLVWYGFPHAGAAKDFISSFGLLMAAPLILLLSYLEFKIIWRGNGSFVVADAFAPLSFGLVVGVYLGFYL